MWSRNLILKVSKRPSGILLPNLKKLTTHKEKLMSSKLVRVLRLCQTISLFFFLGLVAVSAQTITPKIKSVPSAESSVQPSSAPAENGAETERIRTLEETLRQQNEKIDQMLKLIQRQQQMIDSLDARTARQSAARSCCTVCARVRFVDTQKKGRQRSSMHVSP